MRFYVTILAHFEANKQKIYFFKQKSVNLQGFYTLEPDMQQLKGF